MRTRANADTIGWLRGFLSATIDHRAGASHLTIMIDPKVGTISCLTSRHRSPRAQQYNEESLQKHLGFVTDQLNKLNDPEICECPTQI